MAMLFSLIIFVLAAMDKIPFAPRGVLLLLSAGIFFISYGEFLNHYLRKDRLPIARDISGIYYRETEILVRQNRVSGVVFIIIGIVLVAISAYQYLFGFATSV